MNRRSVLLISWVYRDKPKVLTSYFGRASSCRCPKGRRRSGLAPCLGRRRRRAETESQTTVYDRPSPDRTDCYPPSVGGPSSLSPQPEVGESPARALQNGEAWTKWPFGFLDAVPKEPLEKRPRKESRQAVHV